MKKIFGIAIVLAVLTTLCFGSVALAAGPPEVTVKFEGSNPDITISSQHQLKAGYSTYRETSTFTLTGDGDVVGEITASTGTYHCCRTLPRTELSGGYTASNGDFQSMFESSNVTWKTNPYGNTVPEFESAMYFSQHNLSATGVTTMNVQGGASARCGWGQPLSAGQTFDGNALGVDVSGFNARQEMVVDSGLHPILDDGNFQFYAASDYIDVDLVGSALYSSPIDFGGYTGGDYRTYTDAPTNDSSDRRSLFDYDLWLQKPATIYPNPLTADVDVYAPGSSMMIINAFVKGDIKSPTEVWGDINYSFIP
ncbi:hypothetical protein ES708_14097 [subsurface metagenome]